MTTTTGYQAMTAKEVARYILDNQPLFMLDVRNRADYTDWRIEGESLETMNAPYFELLEGVDAIVARIPAAGRVLVVCAKENSSKFVAEQLVEAGRDNIYYLEGGMRAWSEYLEPVKVGDLQGGGELYQFVRLGKGCLSYMVLSDGEAAVIDALRMTDVFEQFAAAKGAQLKHAIDTHLHADHISGGRALAETTGAAYWLPPADAAEVQFTFEPLEDGRELSVGNSQIKIQALYSPGHTIGSTSLIIDDRYLLSGDILFVESIGRPDLAGCAQDWVADLRQTLYHRYKVLSGELIVLPAHFGNMTELGKGGQVSARLGDLYRHNPGLTMQDEEQFRRVVTENLPPQPNSYQQIRETNMGKFAPSVEMQRDMELGPNRCAIDDGGQKPELKFPHTLTLEELEAKRAGGEPLTVLDVREPAEYAFGHLAGAVSIPLGELEQRMGELNANETIAVICRSGTRSDRACQLLQDKGFKQVRNVAAGMSGWSGPIEQQL